MKGVWGGGQEEREGEKEGRRRERERCEVCIYINVYVCRGEGGRE